MVRHANDDIIISVKIVTIAAKIASGTLAAAMPKPRANADEIIVPIMPIRSVDTTGHMHPSKPAARISIAAMSATNRETVPMPNIAHRNAGVTSIRPL